MFGPPLFDFELMTILLVLYLVGALCSVLFALIVLGSTFKYISRNTLPEQPQTLLFGFIRLRYVGFLYMLNSIVISTLIILGTLLLWKNG